jgi:hypothetical protein
VFYCEYNIKMQEYEILCIIKKKDGKEHRYSRMEIGYFPDFIDWVNKCLEDSE